MKPFANPVYVPLGDERFRYTRQRARATFIDRKAIFGTLDPSRDEVREFFRHRFHCSGRFRGGYGSASILLMLAVRLAVALFFYWLDHRPANIAASGYMPGEPGTLSLPTSVKRLWTRKN